MQRKDYLCDLLFNGHLLNPFLIELMTVDRVFLLPVLLKLDSIIYNIILYSKMQKIG